MARKQFLVTWWRKDATFVEAENPELAAKYTRPKMGTTWRDIVVYAHDDLYGDHPIPVHLPEEDQL